MNLSPRGTVASLLSAAIAGLRGASQTGVLIGEGHRLFGANGRARTLLRLDDVPEEGIDWVGMTPSEYRAGDDQAIHEATKFGASRWFRKEFFVSSDERVMLDLLVVATEIDPFRWIALLREPGSSPLRTSRSPLRALDDDDLAAGTFRLARRVAGAGTMAQVLTAVDRLAAGAIGCTYVNVGTTTEWGTLHVHHDPGAAPGVAERYAEVPRDDSTLLGEVYVTNRALLLDVHAFAERYPTLGQDAGDMGFTHLAAVPMHADDGRIVGVLGAAWSDGVDPSHLDHVEAIGDLLGNAIDLATDNARARLMAASFQDMLLPARLDEVAGADVAVRYRAVDRAVGGDFYDVITKADGRSWFVIGDVAGHGLPASRTMGKIRFFLRAVLRHEDEPAEILRGVHDLLLTEDMDELATCMVGRWDPQDRTLTFASAGHLPPVLACDGEAITLEVTPDPPLGTPGVEFAGRQSVHAVERPARLALFTDGLIERRDEDIDTSIAGLLGRCSTLERESLERAADLIVDQATGSGDDDLALLLIGFG